MAAAVLFCAGGVTAAHAAADCSGFPPVKFFADLSPEPSTPKETQALGGVWVGEIVFKSGYSGRTEDEPVCAKLYVQVRDARTVKVLWCFHGTQASHAAPSCSDEFTAQVNGRTLFWHRFVDNGKMSFSLNAAGTIDGIQGSTKPEIAPDSHGVFHREKS